MDLFRSPLFVICSVLFLLHQVVQHGFKVSIPVADAYLDNLVAMPITLHLLVAEGRYLFERGSSYYLPVFEALLATLYVSIISEVLFPLLSSRFVFDPLDFLFFFLGAGLYLFIHAANKRSPQQDFPEGN